MLKGATREERIQELKSLRAELLAMREKAPDGKVDTIERQSSLDSLRKEYDSRNFNFFTDRK